MFRNSDVELAKKLIDVAREADVDAVKFQTFHAKEIISSKGKKTSYQHRAKEKTQYEMFENLQFRLVLIVCKLKCKITYAYK